MAQGNEVEGDMLSATARKKAGKRGTRTLLAVDDEPAVRDLLRDVLRPVGYRVLCADTGAKALAQMRRERVDLVILDLGMPDMTGIQVLRRIRRLPRPPVVVVLTGFGDLDSVREVMRLGAYDYLTKPCDLECLGRVIEEALEPAPGCED